MAKSKSISKGKATVEQKTSKAPKVPANFKAALTDKAVCAGEKAAQSWGVTRRLAYVLLTRSSQQLLKELREGGDNLAEAMMDEAESLRDFLAWREKETELLNAAWARMLLVLGQYSDESGASHG